MRISILNVCVVALVVVLVGGCGNYQLADTEERPVLLDEYSEQHSFYVTRITWNALLGTCVAQFLVERAPGNDSVRLRHIVRSTPDRRKVHHLRTLSEWLTNDLPEGRVRWMISNDPPVIGLAASPLAEPPRNRDLLQKLIVQTDLEEKVDLLIVRDKWPGGVSTQYNPHLEPPPSGRRFIKLDPPKTLREIMATRPWLR